MIIDLMEQSFQQSVTAYALFTRYSIPTLLFARHTHLSSWRVCGELIYWLTLHSAALRSAEPNLLTFHSPSNGTELKADIYSARLYSSQNRALTESSALRYIELCAHDRSLGSSAAKSFLVPSPAGLVTTVYSLTSLGSRRLVW
jgi:hypothetical protein